jgi:hypothetical protein
MPRDSGGIEDLTSAYLLRSRDHDLPELKSADAWAKLETDLRRAVQEAATQLLTVGRIDTAAHEKYFRSLTEQEIILGLPGYHHVSGTGEPLRASAGEQASQAIAFVREIMGDAAHARGSATFIEHQPRLDALKAGIRRVLIDDSIVMTATTWTESGELDAAYLPAFATTIEYKLKAAIDRHIARVEAAEHSPRFAVETERTEHEAFANERLRVFIGRDRNRAAIASSITGASSCPLVVHGVSGSGKSALMARAIADAQLAYRTPVIYRFIGATAASSDFRLLLTSLVDDLADGGIAHRPDRWENDANKFAAQIRTLLASLEEPVIIFLDALDQLRLPYYPAWLPDRLPRSVKIIVSTLDDERIRSTVTFIGAYGSGCHRNPLLRSSLSRDYRVEISCSLLSVRRIAACKMASGPMLLANSRRRVPPRSISGSPLRSRRAGGVRTRWSTAATVLQKTRLP